MWSEQESYGWRSTTCPTKQWLWWCGPQVSHLWHHWLWWCGPHVIHLWLHSLWWCGPHVSHLWRHWLWWCGPHVSNLWRHWLWWCGPQVSHLWRHWLWWCGPQVSHLWRHWLWWCRPQVSHILTTVTLSSLAAPDLWFFVFKRFRTMQLVLSSGFLNVSIFPLTLPLFIGYPLILVSSTNLHVFATTACLLTLRPTSLTFLPFTPLPVSFAQVLATLSSVIHLSVQYPMVKGLSHIPPLLLGILFLSRSALLIMSLLSDPELKHPFSVLPTNCLNVSVVNCFPQSAVLLDEWVKCFVNVL